MKRKHTPVFNVQPPDEMCDDTRVLDQVIVVHAGIGEEFAKKHAQLQLKGSYTLHNSSKGSALLLISDCEEHKHFQHT